MKHLLAIIVLLAALCCCTTEAERNRMRSGLDSINVRNRTDQPFTSQDVEPYVEFFDDEGTPNDRLLAHYLLGRSYHEKGEAPMALECYQHAIDCADTLSADCDYPQLARVYVQKGNIFYQQGLFREQLEHCRQSVKYAWKGKDTLAALISYEQESLAYLNLHMEDSLLLICEQVSQLYRKYGYEHYAARALGYTLRTLVTRKEFDKARNNMQLYEEESEYFDSLGNIQKGREIYYRIKGLFYLHINVLDSAEYYFRKELRDGKDFNNQNAASKGLADLYQILHQPDSATKYAIYAYAMNDSLIGKRITKEVERIQAMYDYSRHQQIARRESEKASSEKRRRELVTMLLLVIVAAASFVIYRIYAMKNEKQRLYLQTLERYEQTHLEVMQLREHADEYGVMIHEKEGEIAALRELVDANNDVLTKIQEREGQIEVLRERLAEFKDSIADREATIAALKSRLTEYQEKRQKGNGRQESQIKESSVYSTLLEKQSRSKLNQRELRECRRLAFETLPELETLLLSGQYHLNETDFNVCMLMRFGFKSKEVSVLLGISQARVSQICAKVLRVVFQKDDGGAAELTTLLYALH